MSNEVAAPASPAEVLVEQEKKTSKDTLSIRMISAAVIVGFFLLIESWLIWQIVQSGGIKAEVWDQIMVPVTAIATLATAAAGVLLGVQVQQANVVSANEQAAQAKVDAEMQKQKKEEVQESYEHFVSETEKRAADSGSGKDRLGSFGIDSDFLDLMRSDLYTALRK